MLLLSLLPLFAAPLLYKLCHQNKAMIQLMDGFIFVAIGGLIISGILPEILLHGGWWSLLFLGLGLALPVFSERLFHNVKSTHKTALVLSLLGLFIHAITDGAALALGENDGHVHSFLSLSVLLHRIPIGLTIWWFVKPQFGSGIAFATLIFLALGTVIGHSQVPFILGSLDHSGFAFFQAFVAGTLVHIIFHRPHIQDDCHAHHPRKWWEGLGNMLGGGVVIYLASHHNHLTDLPWFQEMSHTFYDLAIESAPALLLAFILAGLVSSLMPQSYVNWMKAGSRLRQSLRGVAVGLPLPVCSCGVVPLYHSLIRKGAPPTAAMAFLIATPELGIDAVLISLPLLGGSMTIVRIIAAGIVAFLVSIIVGKVVSSAYSDDHQDSHSAVGSASFLKKLKHGLTIGVAELVDHTGPWIFLGLLIAAGFQPLLGAGIHSSIGPGWEIPLFALLGMPLYVCASGATPMVAIFLMNGVSPGAALAFLITGPATNVTTIAVLNKLHGRKTAMFFGLVTLTVTVALGFATNAFLPNFQPKIFTHDHEGSLWLEMICLALLLLLFLSSLLRRGARSLLGELFSQGHHHHDHDHHDHHHHGHHHNHDHHDHGHHHHDHHHNHNHDHHDHRRPVGPIASS